jgi:hypothetical protein
MALHFGHFPAFSISNIGLIPIFPSSSPAINASDSSVPNLPDPKQVVSGVLMAYLAMFAMQGF